MSILPTANTREEYEAIWADDSVWLALVQALMARHGLKGSLERYRQGTAVVHRIGDLVLKVYPLIYAEDAELEAEVLVRLAVSAKVPSPRVVAKGQLEGWPYLLMTRIEGTRVEALWASMDATQRTSLMTELGELTRHLHETPGAGLPRADADWMTFRSRCRQRAVQKHMAGGLSAEREAVLSAYLTELDPEPEATSAQVLLHTELGPDHLRVDQGRLSGLLDFGDAREGPPEYDFAPVGIFITRGDREAFRAFLDGYGLPIARRGPRLVRRLMRHALLHAYGPLPFCLARSPVPDEGSFDAIAQHWFAH